MRRVCWLAPSFSFGSLAFRLRYGRALAAAGFLTPEERAWQERRNRVPRRI